MNNSVADSATQKEEKIDWKNFFLEIFSYQMSKKIIKFA